MFTELTKEERQAIERALHHFIRDFPNCSEAHHTAFKKLSGYTIKHELPGSNTK